MRSATAGACGSSRRIPRPRLPPACSFFSGKKKGRASGAPDVVLHGRKSIFLRREAPRPLARPALWRPGRGASCPANPYSSSGGTTSLSSAGPLAPWTWCFMVRKSLFLRREAPRPCVRPDLRRPGRGAPWPGNPYSFVGRHHVPEVGRPFGAVDVVFHGPQILIPSSRGTTSLRSAGPLAPWTWCSMSRKSLFLRREAPCP